MNIDLHCTDTNVFKMSCKSIAKNDFIGRWTAEMWDTENKSQVENI